MAILPQNKVTFYSASNRVNFGRSLKETIRQFPAAHRLAIRLFKRDLKAQYRQSVLGLFWTIVPPLTTAALWIFLKGNKVIDFGDTGVSYPLFVITGTLMWQVFSDSFNAPLRSVSSNKSVLVKLNIPREGLLLSGVYSMFFNLLIKLFFLGVVFVYFEQDLTVSILLFPIGLLSIIICGFSLGLILVPIGMLYGDIQRIITIALPFAMYLTPVIYPPKMEGKMALLLQLNPMANLLTTTRNWFTSQPVSDVPTFIFLTTFFFLLMLIALAVYRISMPIIIERIGN